MKNQNLALLLIRVTLFAVFIYHGAPKALDFEMAMTKFTNMGFPGVLGPVIGIIEVIGAFTILLGVKNKETNIILGAIILTAIVGVQIPGAISKGKLLPAGLERDLLMLSGHYLLLVFGAGSYKVFANSKGMKETLHA